MEFYTLKIGNLKRELPLVSISPKLKIASVNLLGDRQMVEELSAMLSDKIKNIEFDFLVGPEVKVLPILHEISKILKKQRYVVCRKRIYGYMVLPVVSKEKPGLVLDGRDAKLINGKKVLILDDVVSTGRTIRTVDSLMTTTNAKVVGHASLFKQGNKSDSMVVDLIYLIELPLFPG